MDHKIETYLEPIIEEFTTGEFYREVFEAKQQFLKDTGKIHDADPDYEQRMNLFMNWYCFDRDIKKYHLSPIKIFFRKYKKQFNPESLEIYRSLCMSYYSLFEVSSVHKRDHRIQVVDCFSHRTYSIKENDFLRAFNPGSIFEGRIVHFSDTWQFVKGFSFHDPQVASLIKKRCSERRYQSKSRQIEFIFECARQKFSASQFPQKELRLFYQGDA